jgi:hypothetical protein
MLFKWTPNGVLDSEGNDLGAMFSGHVELEIKNKVDRLKMAKGMELNVNGKAEVEAKDSIYEQVESADKIVRECVKSIELKVGEIEIKSLDDLEMFQEGVVIVNEIFAVCLGGIRLGKHLKGK